MKKKLSDLELTEIIYSAALGEINWQRAINNISNAFDSPAGGFFVQHDNSGGASLLGMQGIPENSMASYSEHYHTVNPWFLIPGMMDLNRIRTDGDLNQHHRDNNYFGNTEFCNDWISTFDVNHAVGGSIATRGTLHLNFTLLRPSSTGQYRAEEVKQLQRLVPHLRRALEVRTLFEAARERHSQLLKGMDKIGMGVVLLGAQLKIFELNESAKSIISGNDGLTSKNNTLRVEHHKTQKMLKELYSFSLNMINNQNTGISEWFYIPRPSGKAEYQMLIITSLNPIALFSDTTQSGVALLIDPTTPKQIPSTCIQQRFSLTERETDVALLLLNGKTTRQIATELEVTYESARTYVKKVCHKTNTHSQSEFVARILNEIALIV